MRKRMATLFAPVVVVMSLVTQPVSSGEEAIKAEQLLPEKTAAAIFLPDLASARDGWAKTNLAGLYAKPEMQAFLKLPCQRLKEAYEKLRATNPLIPSLTDLDSGLLSGEIAMCVYLRDDPGLPAGILLTLAPKDPAAFLRMLPGQFRQALQTGELVPMGPPQGAAPAMVWKKQRLLVCFPIADAKDMLARLDAPPAQGTLAHSPSFTKTRASLTPSAGFVYADARQIKELLTRFAKAEGDREIMQGLAIMQLMGLDDLTVGALSVGFNESNMFLETFIGLVDQPKSPLFNLGDCKTPFPAEALKLVPADAPYVSAGRMRLSGLLDTIRQTVVKVEPRMAAEFDKGLAQIQKTLDLDIQQDLLAQLGDEIVSMETAVDTAAPLSFWPGMVTCIPLKDAARVTGTLDKLEQFSVQMLQQAKKGNIKAGIVMDLLLPDIRHVEHAGKSIRYLRGNVINTPTAWCVAGNRLLVGTSVNAVRRTLDQMDRQSDILSNKAFQDTITRLTGKPFDPAALPAAFAFAHDRGSGTGSLVLLSGGMVGSALGVGGLRTFLQPAIKPPSLNEAEAIRSCFYYAEAQDIYHETDWDKDGVNEYAQSFRGKNSLYDIKPGEGDMLLINEEMAEAEGAPGAGKDCKGYRFKLLKEQGADAEGGAKSYMKEGHQVAGYALVAYPAKYGETGKRSFVVSKTGKIHAKDLGPKTHETIVQMKAYNPDHSWTEVEPDLNEGPVGVDPFDRFIGGAGGALVVKVLRDFDLGLWPDEGFFAAQRRPVGAMAVRLPNGVLYRTEFPLPMPGMGDSSSIAMAGIPIMAGMLLPALARAREQARSASSANNLRQIIIAWNMYKVDLGKYPQNPNALFPKYIESEQVFRNPRYAEQDVGYYYVPGVTQDGTDLIVFFENIPAGKDADGRNVAFTDGRVRWLDEDEFRARLEQTEEALKKRKVELNPLPIPVSKLRERGPGAEF